MKRYRLFRALMGHAWYGPKVSKLRSEQQKRIFKFLFENEELDAGEFCQKVNKEIGDDPIVSELLMLVK